MPGAPSEDFEFGQLEHGADDDQKEPAEDIAKAAGGQMPETGGHQDERPKAPDEVAEIKVSQMVEKKQNAGQDEDEAPEYASR